MNILQINVDWNNGGPGSIAKSLSDAVVEAGGKSYIAYGRGQVDLTVNSYKIGSYFSKYYDALITRLCDNAGFGTTGGTKRLLKYIDACTPDIIQLHTLLGYYINIETLLKGIEERKIPIVWTIHDTWLITGHCINFDRVGCEKWKKECCQCPLRKDYPPSYFIDRSWQNFNRKRDLLTSLSDLHLVTPSKWMEKIISQSYLSKYPHCTIYNGINLTEFMPIENDLRIRYGIDDKIVLLAVANVWNEMKGAILLGEIAERLDDNYIVIMIGNIQTSPNTNKIIRIPAIRDKRELAKWYSAANVFINPTFGDNFPTVNIEALACGIPVVTNDTGGSSEIAGNDFGKVVYSKTAEEFVERIKECVEEKYTEEACRRHAYQFSDRNVFKKYIDLYRLLLN